MAANKAQFEAILATKSGLTLAQAQAATNALNEALGEWMKAHGAIGPGTFAGEIDGGLKLDMARTPSPAPHWTVKASFTASGLDDYGDGATRFGLAVENA